VLTSVALISVRIITGEDSWICDNGEWVKHGYPISPKPTSECVPDDSGAGTQKQENRKISGKFTFPPDAEGAIDMSVCAKSVNSDKEYCTYYPAKQTESLAEINYEIKLFPGSYLIYAFDYNDRGRASFYTNYVTCGMTESCTSHENIPVVVPQFSDISGIDPIDWEDYKDSIRLREEDAEYNAANPITPDDVDLGLPPE